MPDTDNGRITLAILSTKLDNLLQKIGEYHQDAEENAAAIRVDAKERESRIRCLEERMGRVEERQGIYAIAQGVYATVAAFVAGLLK